MATRQPVTIIMTQRERFDLVCRSIESLYCSTEQPFNLIYVDGYSSSDVYSEVEKLASNYDFRILRKEHFLPPNVARNIAIDAIDEPTKYTVFVDNDVIYEKGWLERLLETADETGAAVVSPLIMIGNPDVPESLRIHFAGGKISIKETAEGRQFHDTHILGDQSLETVEKLLERSTSDSVEFHAVLIRNEILEKIAPLDENLRATSEHLDLSLQIKRLGKEIIFEPSSRVTYIVGKPLGKFEINYFILRWSDYWAKYSERHFQEKWGFMADNRVIENFVVDHRLHAFYGELKKLEKYFGYRLSRLMIATWFRVRLIKAKRYALPGTLS